MAESTRFVYALEVDPGPAKAGFSQAAQAADQLQAEFDQLHLPGTIIDAFAEAQQEVGRVAAAVDQAADQMQGALDDLHVPGTVAAQADQLQAELSDASQAVAALDALLEQLDFPVELRAEVIAGFKEGLQEAGMAAQQMGAQLEAAGTGARGAQGSLQRMQGQVTGVASAFQRNANPALASFSYVMNDSMMFTYGFRQGLMGIANNVGPLIQQLQSLKAATGSSVLAMKALGASMLGPMGIVIAINAAMTAVMLFGSKSKDAFGGAKKAAEDAAKEIERMKSAVEGLVDVTDPAAKYAGSVTNIAVAAVAAREEMERLEGQLKDLERTMSMRPDLISEEDLRRQKELQASLAFMTAVYDGLASKASSQAQAQRFSNILADLGLTKAEGRSRTEGEISDILVKQQERYEELTQHLTFLKSADGERYIGIKNQNTALEEQIKLYEEIAPRIRAMQAQRIEPISMDPDRDARSAFRRREEERKAADEAKKERAAAAREGIMGSAGFGPIDMTERMKAEYEDLKVSQDKWMDGLATATHEYLPEILDMAGRIGDAFEGWVSGTMTAQEAFSRMAASIISDLKDMIVHMIKMKVLQGAMSAGAGFGAIAAVGIGAGLLSGLALRAGRSAETTGYLTDRGLAQQGGGYMGWQSQNTQLRPISERVVGSNLYRTVVAYQGWSGVKG